MEITCKSSCFHSADYDADTETLSVKFPGNNKTYYYRVTQNVVDKMLASKSAGAYFIQHIKRHEIQHKK